MCSPEINIVDTHSIHVWYIYIHSPNKTNAGNIPYMDGIDTKHSGSEHVSPASNMAISLWKFKQQKSLKNALNNPAFFIAQLKPRRFPLCWKEHSGRWTSPSHTFMKAFTHLEAWKLYHERCVPLAEKKVCWESWDIYQPTNQPNKHFTHLSLSLKGLYTLSIRVFFSCACFTPLPTQADKLHIRKILEGFMVAVLISIVAVLSVPKPSKNLKFNQSILIRYPSQWK